MNNSYLEKWLDQDFMPTVFANVTSEKEISSRPDTYNTKKTRYNDSFDAMIYAIEAEKKLKRSYEIKRVIFHEPATIVYWEDGTKTVVKCKPGDIYNKETGLAIAICKKLYGNGNAFKKLCKKWVKDDDR